ncbi:hypothetical protein CVD19_20610 [Bacillus sp. T33-2]|nr:hypothetical protein CVD19_20610 [Bacillus sp. T33-2]
MNSIVENFITYFEYLLAMMMGTQAVYAFCIFLLGETMMTWFEWGYYEKPKGIYQRCQNWFFDCFIGMGYYIYKKLGKYPWVWRKLYFLVIITVISFAFMFIFMAISDLLRWMLL